MIQFEDRLCEAAQRLASEENKTLHVPSNPLAQKRTYWGWVAAPAAAVAGIVFGMSLDLLSTGEPEVRYVQSTDTIEVVRPVRDTIYLTQVVEKVRIVNKPTDTPQPAVTTEAVSTDADDVPACTSVQCDGINYASLALN
ncbi:MAG: hypothetical protein IJ148_11515 [Bacteroidaceae bacterium]|nr:hypothetical protein [Bacteroidaceae bacterium]MBQ9171427.1 hypothetical protein [Bacteroidaceae bacterium]